MGHACTIDQDRETNTRRRRWLIGSAALLLAIVAVGAFVVLRDDGPEEVFCTVEGLIAAKGEMYGRTGPDCRFVDGDGRTLTTLSSGQPLCYDDLELMTVASCDRPGVTAAEDL